jgi:hypothetical protein
MNSLVTFMLQVENPSKRSNGKGSINQRMCI